VSKSEKEKKRTGSILEIIFFFFGPYKLRVGAMLVLFLLTGALEAATIAAVYPILSVAFGTGAGQGGFVLSFFARLADILPIKDTFIAYCVIFLVLAVLSFIVKLFSATFRIKLTAVVVENNQNAIYQQYLQADYQYFIDHKQGDMIYNAATAPLQISSLMSGVTELISQVILSISVFVLLFSLSWQGSIAVLFVGVSYQFLSRYLGKKVSYQSGKGEMEAFREYNVILNETISGIKQVKAFGVGDSWKARFRGTVTRLWQFVIKRTVWSQIPPLLLFFVMYLAVGIIVLAIKIAAPANFMTLIPVFGAFAFAVFRLVPFISSIGGVLMSVMSSLPDCEAVYSILSEKITHIEDGKKEFGSFKSEIKFDNVSFTHKHRKKTLNGISVTFEKGKTTAIVGRSGSGKTTLINLLLRLFDVDQGEIKIDGVNIKEFRLASWLEDVGFVSQDTFILNDTIETNITFGSEGYTHEQVIEAAGYADAHAFISELPGGYGTLVGDKGVRLSGGQAQRIAVARAMIRKPEILVFDEATNNLDNISETAVQRAIEEISKGHTVIIIAHRLSTVVNADKIIVFEDGRVVEQGNHALLLEKRGAYWELYQSRSM
jgi:ABC-type multidrug transport system fused ATPase/permease subunit